MGTLFPHAQTLSTLRVDLVYTRNIHIPVFKCIYKNSCVNIIKLKIKGTLRCVPYGKERQSAK